MLVCVYEDRPAAEPGVRLLLASLLAHEPAARVHLHYPPADARFADWLARYPSVTLDRSPFARGGWNVKPAVLLAALDRGEAEAVWVDSDVVAAGPLAPLLAGLDPEVLVAAEEALWGTPDDGEGERARAWGWPVGRALPFTVNSCVVRATAHHRPLLRAWARCLGEPAYAAAQAGPYAARPRHLVGDQDVLTALLASAAFADVPLAALRRGRHILQLFGLKAFSLAERVEVARRGLPPLVHAQGEKPWGPPPATALERAFADASPYLAVARRHRAALVDDRWLAPRTAGGRALLALGGDVPWLAGLPVSAAVDLASALRRRGRAGPRGPEAGLVRLPGG